MRRLIASTLIVGGLAALGWGALDRLSATWYQRQSIAELESRRTSPTPMPPTPPASLPVGEPVGRLTIARLGLSAVVVEGDDDAVLDRAIGHLPDTPLPWHTGNAAIAAHRDAIFRPLKDIRKGDVVRLETPYGDFDYRVSEIMIVKPTDVWVLDDTSTSMLTLISCYPFYLVGNAPERFIVRAERLL